MQRYWIDPADIFDDEGNTSIQCEFEELEDILRRDLKSISVSMADLKMKLLPRETRKLTDALLDEITETKAAEWIQNYHTVEYIRSGFAEIDNEQDAVEVVMNTLNAFSSGLNFDDLKAGGDMEILLNLPLPLLEARNKQFGIALLPGFYEVASWSFRMWFNKAYIPRGEWIAKQLVFFYREKIKPIQAKYWTLLQKYFPENASGARDQVQQILRNYMNALVFIKYGKFLPSLNELPQVLKNADDRKDFAQLYKI